MRDPVSFDPKIIPERDRGARKVKSYLLALARALASFPAGSMYSPWHLTFYKNLERCLEYNSWRMKRDTVNNVFMCAKGLGIVNQRFLLSQEFKIPPLFDSIDVIYQWAFIIPHEVGYNSQCRIYRALVAYY